MGAAHSQAWRSAGRFFDLPPLPHKKVADAIVKGVVTRETVQKLLRGVELEDGVARAESVSKLTSNREDESKVRIMLREGRNRE